MIQKRNMSPEELMKEALTQQVNAWAVLRLLREARNSRRVRSDAKTLTEREALTLFLVAEFSQEVRAQTLTQLFGIQYSSAAHIITSLEKRKCIKEVERGGHLEVLENGRKLLGEYKSREASTWHDVYSEMNITSEMLEHQLGRLSSLITTAKKIFTEEFFDEPSVRVD